jgi:threonylcarbamoyladenosine tRNA methylthiotransferase MtaB
MTSFFIQSFGCRVNQAEAFTWANAFQNHGLVYEKDLCSSDIILVNTCTITSGADRDVRNFLRKVSRLNPDARLILTGCYAENRFEELRRYPQVWFVFPNAEKNQITERILPLIRKREKTKKRSYRSRGLVKIHDGCDFRCTFCVIPSVRGRSVSLDEKDIISQINNFIDQGFREIVLTGIHICCYGQNNGQKTSLLDLLKKIETLAELGWVRLSSLDPRFLDDALLEHITSSQKICPHYHLSLQHGSGTVLRRMGRNIEVERYRRILGYLRQNRPEASLGADILVGFPEESEEEFAEMADFLEESPLSYLHVFSYSPRKGTPAAGWIPVNHKIKKERASRLRKMSLKKNKHFRQQFLGRVLDGIVIKKDGEENGVEIKSSRILTTNYLKVSVAGCPAEKKEAVKVRISGAGTNESPLLRGQVICV